MDVFDCGKLELSPSKEHEGYWYGVMDDIELPEENFTTYRLSNCKHGKIHMNYYTSTQTDRKKLCYVYTPADYEVNPEKSYPVLYLQDSVK